MNQDERRIAQARLERIPCGDLGNGYFRNPVMVGPGSDNTVIRVESDFYMMAGGGWPDQLVWHSRDLVNWRPITRALRVYDGRAWASDLVYHGGRFYIYTTQVDPGRGYQGPLNLSQRSLLGKPCQEGVDEAFKNVVLWADDPAGPWSDPIDLGVYGYIDPGHIVDPEGNRYLYFSKGTMVRLAPDGLSTVGPLRQVYEGWPYPAHWVVECMCLEAPKLTYRDGWYYMASAQGGTAGPSTAHMAVMARSRSVEGPWENSPYNPVVRTERRDETWWRQGHGTLIDDVAGQWWFLYTGYENGYTAFGKQSLLLPVEWTADGWPRIVPGVGPEDVLPMPAGENVGHGMPLSDDFASDEIGAQWMWDPATDPDQAFAVGGGALRLRAGGGSPLEAVALSVMAVNHAYEVEVEVTVPAGAEGGILLAPATPGGNWAAAGLKAGEVFAKWPAQANHLPYEGQRVAVRVRNDRYDVSCFYRGADGRWVQFPNATEVTSCRRVSLYAAGEGEVVFERFAYRGLD